MTRDIQDRLEMFGSTAVIHRIALTYVRSSSTRRRRTPRRRPMPATPRMPSGSAMSSWELDAFEPRVIVDLIREAVRRGSTPTPGRKRWIGSRPAAISWARCRSSGTTWSSIWGTGTRMADVPKMRPKKTPAASGGYSGCPDMDPEGVGPYDSKDDVLDDMHGLERFYKYLDVPGYTTIEDLRQR